MTDLEVRSRFRRTVGSGPPADLDFGEPAFSDADDSFHIGKEDGSVVTFTSEGQGNNGGGNSGWLASSTGIPFAVNTVIEFTHGLGREPIDFKVGARVTAPINGYLAGDFIPLSLAHFICSLRVNGTVISFMARNMPAIVPIDDPSSSTHLPIADGTIEFYVK